MINIKPDKLSFLHDRLRDQQRKMILAPADTGRLPPKNAMSMIADLETGIVAVETMLDETDPELE